MSVGHSLTWLRKRVVVTRINRLAARVANRWARVGTEEHVDAMLLGRFELDRVLGRGSYGVVFAAFDRSLERDVALKVFSAASTSDVLHEARALARVSHPNVIPVYDIGRALGFVYLVMPLIDGGTMTERMRDGLGWRDVVELFVAAGRGLAAAHATAVVHGDIKPSNILIGRDGSVFIADFGLSRTGERTKPLGLGTMEYVAPECWAGAEPGPLSDQFSFCVSLWEALYGARPWAATSASHVEREPGKLRPRDDIPAQLEQALRRGLASQPRERHPDMQALIDDLEDALQWGSA